MAKASPFDPELVRELAELLAETDLSEIEVEKGDLRIRVARSVTATVTIPAGPTPAPTPSARPVLPPPVAPPEAAAKPAAAHPGMIPPPMAGTAFRKPSPEAK